MNTNCCLLKKEKLTANDLSTKKIKSYEESSHYDRLLVRCNSCGELFLYEFYEYVDFSGGNDKIYCTYIPVENEEEADRLNKSKIRDLRPAIFWDEDVKIML